jgi:hypothetical protein
MNRSAVIIVFILLFSASTVFASGNGKVFSDDDLQQYDSPSERGSETYEDTSDKGRRAPLSPLESDLRKRKDEVTKDNRDYIENQYEWMKNDCLQYSGEMKKDCFFRTEAWHKEQLRQVEELKKYLEK